MGSQTVREETDHAVGNSMWRLYAEYGRANAVRGAVGVIGTIAARLCGLVPGEWLPTTSAGQLWASVAVLVAATLLGAAATYTQNWGWNSFAQRVSTRFASTRTTACSSWRCASSTTARPAS